MKKDTIRAIVVAVILLVVYHLIIFLIPFAQTPQFWISYSFSLAAFAVVAGAIYIAFLKKPDAKSKFYGFPIARVGTIYGLLQFAVSLIVMALGVIFPWWLAVLLYSVGFGAAVIGLVSVEAVVDQIQIQDEKLKRQTAHMRALQSKLGQLAAQWDDPAIRALAEEFRYSDPVSSDALAEVEADLSAVVDELQAAVVDGDGAIIAELCQKASGLLTERNRQCKLNK